MNFKKFISGVSALTIAASAFGGMAVTASAADAVSKQYTVTENFDDATFDAGTLTGTGNKAVTVDATTFTGTEFGSAKTYVGWGNSVSYAGLYDETSGKSIGAGTNSNASNAQTTYTTLGMVTPLTGDATNTVSVSFKWYNGEFLGASSTTANTTFASILDSSGNKIMTLRWYRVSGGGNFFVNNDGALGTEIASEAKASQQWYTVNATLDFTNKKITSLTWVAGNYSYSKTDLDFESSAATNMGQIAFGISKARNAATNAISKIDDFSVTGYADSYKVSIPVTDGTAPVTGATVTLTGVAANTDTVTATDDNNDGTYEAYVPAGSTPSYSVTKEGYTSAAGTLAAVADDVTTADQVITIPTEEGYIINTRPYAAISVDGAAAVSTGKEGKYQFALGTTGTHTVEISKDGYQTVNTTVTAADNDSTTLALNPNSGISYQEDFTYVDDNFGATKATVSNGTIVYSDGTKDSSEEITLPETVDVAGTVVTLRLKKGRIDRNCTVAFGAFSFYLPLGNVQHSNNKFDGVLTANEYSSIQLYIPTSDDNTHRPILYVDGVRYNVTDNARQAARTVNTLYFKNNGNYPTITIDYIKVEKLASGNTEPTATVTVDGTATSYLKGTTVTIPAAAEGYEWHDANDNVVSAGDMVVNADLTLTAVAVQPEAVVSEVSYNQYEAANTAANDQDITAAKILVTVTGSIDTLGLKYNGGSAKYVQNFEGLTNANIVLGAIVPGLVTLTTSSFDAVIE